MLTVLRRLDRNVAIAGTVVLFHVAALWALNAGLLRRVAEIVVPVEMLSEILTPPVPRVDPVPRPAPPPEPVQRPVARKVQPAPQPIAIPDPRPAPDAPTGIVAPQPPAPPIVAASPPSPPAPAPAPAPAKIELPSSDAAYLQNPKPAYPPMSRRLGERGEVLLRVLIGTDGLPQKIELIKSSGHDRLDQAAQATVMKWRFVPGKRAGVPETAWAQVPINFVLE